MDIRKDAPTFGKWVGVELTAENRKQLFIPIGFAHGFGVLADEAEFQYKCSAYYVKETDVGITWNDPDIGVEWPVSEPIISERDKNNISLAQYKEQIGK